MNQEAEPRVLVIAEIGVNHDGSVSKALELVDAAAEAGADVVKTQTFDSTLVASTAANRAPYQLEGSEPSSQLDMIRALELSHDEHWMLLEAAQSKGIDFMSTAFDLPSLRFLVDELRIPRVKVPSGEMTNLPLLLACGSTNKELIASTGMCNTEEIRSALLALAAGRNIRRNMPGTSHWLDAAELAPNFHELKNDDWEILTGNTTILHCTTAYPCPPNEVNLLAMPRIGAEFGLSFGYSDHTVGTSVAPAAVALGATVIEKHLTLSKESAGPDHSSSLEPKEFAEMVGAVRLVEQAKGEVTKTATVSELENMPHARRSIVAARDLQVGQTIGWSDLAFKRPATGVSPMDVNRIVGMRAPEFLPVESPLPLHWLHEDS